MKIKLRTTYPNELNSETTKTPRTTALEAETVTEKREGEGSSSVDSLVSV
jgi:hypothetical protein